jgi:hypothetical protein
LISVRSEVRILPGPPYQTPKLEAGNPSGGVAQLGERLLCKQEVIGSIPFTSTSCGHELRIAGAALGKVCGSRGEFGAGVSPSPEVRTPGLRTWGF